MKGRAGRKHEKKDLNYFAKYYPYTYMVEELRENPDTGIVECHCKFEDCKHSEKNDGWFILDTERAYYREWALIRNWDSYCFYCTDNCKDLCPLHGKNAQTIIKERDLIVSGFYEESEEWIGYRGTEDEKKIFRKTVFELDNYRCLYCGEPAHHVHHIEPVKLKPIFALDPPNGISVCVPCHQIYCHPAGTECSTGNLANRFCYPIIRDIETMQKKEKGAEAPIP